ncbi:MAG: PIG-L family deacetylase [Sedimentisphaerales bacterium]|nr:PIG-L family deacetylase [Sedimentisphaerales bacterium]
MKKTIVYPVTLTLIVLGLLAGIRAYSTPAGKRDLSTSPLTSERVSVARPGSLGKLNVIAFGAHPDDCEIRAGGVAAMWSSKGHKVNFVSTTNGDIGHWKMAGGPLAQRRKAEVEKAADILGIETQVLDNHDGELMPTLENRKTLVRLIRQANADIVMSHRPNDYHPDHRYTGILVQDAAFMVICPFFCPEVPHLKSNPVFLYFWDRFQKPNPFEPDIVVAIDSVIDQKLDALVALESQFVEGCVTGNESMIPKNAAERAEAHERVRDSFRGRFAATADQYRQMLIELYGPDKGKKVKYAEAFEVCEYGRQPTQAELLELFPFFEG